MTYIRQQVHSSNYATSEVSEDPYSNTGSNSQEGYRLVAHIDYLSLIGVVDSLRTIDYLVDGFFHSSFDYPSAMPYKCGKVWDGKVMAPTGLCLIYKFVEKANNYDVWLTVPGKPLNNLATDKFWEFIQELANLNFRATRLDIAIDDYSKKLDFDAMELAISRNQNTGFSRYQLQSSKRSRNAEIGRTIYMGSRQSDKFYRMYDKSVESRGEIDAYRFEGEFKGDYAHLLWNLVTESPDLETAIQILAGHAVGSISFVNRIDKNIKRCPKLDWWAEFVDAIGCSIKLSVPRTVKFLEDKVRWINKSVATTLAVIKDCFGEVAFNKFLSDAIVRGRSKYTSGHECVIDTYLRKRDVGEAYVNNS